MLILTIDLIHNSHTSSEKRNLIHRLTEAAVEVEGEAMRDRIFVKMNTIRPSDWAVGGLPLEQNDRLGPAHQRSENGQPGEHAGDAETSNTLRRINRALRREK